MNIILLLLAVLFCIGLETVLRIAKKNTRNFRKIGRLCGGTASTNAGPTPSTITERSPAKLIADQGLYAELAMPAAASTSVYVGPIDLGADAYKRGDRFDVAIVVPALTNTMLPNTRTCTTTLVSDDNTGHTSATAIGAAQVITGAGAGSSETTYRFRIPSGCERYIFAKIDFGASTTDASAVKAQLKLLF